MKTTIKIEVTADELIELVLNANPGLRNMLGITGGQTRVFLLDGTEEEVELKETQKAAIVALDITG